MFLRVLFVDIFDRIESECTTLTVCCLIATMPSGEREPGRKGNPPVNTGPSLNRDERANTTVEEGFCLSRYAEKQRRVMMYTGECISGRRTMEQFLEALMYLMPEPI
ncbi:hypothetical protein T07_8551 [Trichinella nelsoni]|uniref:Uncharacterized protein n=1 Tax=Trichinella nelsoni TaxID=6336 RepID=A0A0V0RFH9_9BILA|nr:hypothetical protein T07_8551 [Trichinella nelsoni]